MSNKNKDIISPNAQKSVTVIEMRNGEQRYPFNHQITTADAFVKYVRRFQSHQQQQIKANIYVHSKLRHQSLIQMTKALQSKNDSYFELRYEYVPFSLQSQLRSLKRQDLLLIRDSLQDLCSYLVAKNIAPPISWQCIGLSDKYTLKYFLPINYGQILTFDKMAYFKNKRQEVNKLFSQVIPVLTPKPSLNPELTRSRSNDNTTTQQRTQFTPLHYSPPPRNSQSTENKCESSLQDSKLIGVQRVSQTQHTNIPENAGSGGQASDQLRKNSSQDASPFSKLKDIDNRIKELRVVKSSNIQLQDMQIGKKSTLPVNPQKPAASPKAAGVIQKNQQVVEPPKKQSPSPKLPAQHINPKQRQNNSPPQQVYKKRAFRYDQDSLDTYCQQLGEHAQMPKIIANTGMRNTTHSPPKLFFAERTKDQKLSESVGFDQNIMIPVPASNISIRSGNTEKSKSPTIPFAQVRAISSESINLQQKVEMPISVPMGSHVNLNVNVAVNLNDLSRKVDAAYGRVRAISQTAENNGIKQMTLKPVATQPCFQKMQSSPPQRVSPPAQQQPPAAKQISPTNQQSSRPVQYLKRQNPSPPTSSQLLQIQPKLLVPEPRISQVNTKPCIPQLETPYTKNRKHSNTAPNIVLLSPMVLDPHKNLFPDVTKEKLLNSPKANQSPKDYLKLKSNIKQEAEADRKDSKTEMQEDFKELRRKDTKDHQMKDIGKDLGKQLSKELGPMVEDQKSREMLYRFQNVFPDYNSDDYKDDTNSMRNPQVLQTQRQELYNQSLKFQDDALVSEFGALFSGESEKQSKSLKPPTQRQQRAIIQLRAEKSEPVNESDKDTRNNQIKQRVKMAFEKSKTTLSYFNRIIVKRPN